MRIENTEVERLEWVDYAKAIGILLVVYGHVARGLFNAGIEIPKDAYLLADSIIYSFHMPLFFFLSGLFFVQSFTRKGGRALVFSKIDAIVYPYLLWSILQGSIEVYLSQYINGNVNWLDVLLLLWHPRAHFWFLYILFFVFIFSTLIYSTKARKYPEVVFVFSLIIHIFPEVLPAHHIFYQTGNFFVYFTLGVIFMKHFSVERFANTTSLCTLGFLFVISQWLFHIYFSYTYSDKGIVLFMLAIVSIGLVISLSGVLARLSLSWLSLIGAMSMHIYLMHILAGSGVRVILSSLIGIDSYVLHVIVGCIIGVVGPIIVAKVLEHYNVKYIFSAPISRLFFTSTK